MMIYANVRIEAEESLRSDDHTNISDERTTRRHAR